MPGDPFAPVRPGQDALEALTSSARVNLWTEAGLAHRRAMGGHTFDSKLLPLAEQEFFVKNTTGADRNRFDIVAFEEPLYLRDDNLAAFNERQQTVMKAIEPKWPDHFLSWGVLQEACRANKFARVRVGGIAVALVNFADADATTGHKYATVKDAEYGYLDSAPCGLARVLWRDTTAVSSTRYWCKLWLGGPLPTSLMARTTSTGTYPTRADQYNAWQIEFVTVSYTNEPGPQALNIVGQGMPYFVARNVHNDPFVPQGTILEVWHVNGRWWFDYADEIQRGTLQGELVAGGTVSVKVQVNGADTPGGAVEAVDKLGVMTGVGTPVSGETCYIKWQREHAEYWIIQKECDNSASSSTLPLLPQPSMIQPRREEYRTHRAGAF